MKKWLSGSLIFILLVIIAAVLIIPYVIGASIKKEQENTIQRLSAEGVDIKVNNYQQGWFKSTADVTLTIPALNAEWQQMQLTTAPLNFEMAVKIYHGPIMLVSTTEGSRVEFGKAFAVLEAVKPAIPLDATIKAAFDDSRSFQLKLAQYQSTNEQAFSLLVKNLTIDGKYSELFKEFKSDIHADMISLSSQDVVESANNIRYSMDLKNVQNGLSLGKRLLTVERVNIAPANDKPIAINQLKLLIDLKSANANKISYDLNLSAANYIYDEKSYGPNSLVFQVEDMDSAMLASVKQDIEMLNSNAASEIGYKLKLNRDVIALLMQGFSFNLSEFNLSLPWGNVAAKGNFKVPSVANQSFMNFFKELSANFEATLPAPFVEYLALQYSQAGSQTAQATGNASVPQLAAETSAKNYLQSLLDKNLLTKNNDQYQINLKVDQGNVELNNKPIQLFQSSSTITPAAPTNPAPVPAAQPAPPLTPPAALTPSSAPNTDVKTQ